MMKMRSPVSAAVAIAVGGLLILFAYFFPYTGPLQILRSYLLDWAVTLAGVAALVGALYLFGVHMRRLGGRGGRDYYSLAFLVGFIITVVLGFWLSPAAPLFQKFILSFQIPFETSMLAILSVTLTLAAARLLQRRKGVIGIIFLVSILAFLMLNSGLLSGLESWSGFSSLIHLINRIPLAGARGILIGVALGSLITGLRIMIGADRPYSG